MLDLKNLLSKEFIIDLLHRIPGASKTAAAQVLNWLQALKEALAPQVSNLASKLKEITAQMPQTFATIKEQAGIFAHAALSKLHQGYVYGMDYFHQHPNAARFALAIAGFAVSVVVIAIIFSLFKKKNQAKSKEFTRLTPLPRKKHETKGSVDQAVDFFINKNRL